MSSKSNSNNNIGFTSLRQLAFIVLKLCKVINWSWWWVLAPTWFWIVVLIVVIIISAIANARR